MKLKVQTWLKNKILRSKAEEVKNISEAKEVIKSIKWFLENSDDWVGMAAPQLWISKRIFLACVVENKKKINKKNITSFINPKILKFSKSKVEWQEWCLSLPWIFWDVIRSKEVTVEYFDLNWNKKIEKLKWFWAIVFQHELDHLNWILFFDKIIWGEFLMDKWVTMEDVKNLGIDLD